MIFGPCLQYRHSPWSVPPSHSQISESHSIGQELMSVWGLHYTQTGRERTALGPRPRSFTTPSLMSSIYPYLFILLPFSFPRPQSLLSLSLCVCVSERVCERTGQLCGKNHLFISSHCLSGACAAHWPTLPSNCSSSLTNSVVCVCLDCFASKAHASLRELSACQGGVLCAAGCLVWLSG